MKPKSQQTFSGGLESPAHGVKRAPRHGDSCRTAARISAGIHEGTAHQVNSNRWFSLLLPAFVLGLAAVVMLSEPSPMAAALLGLGAVWVLLDVVTGGGSKLILAGTRPTANKEAKVFTLSLGEETITLDPGKTWIQVDHYKWVVRGLLEVPQMFHVFPDGSVEINAEKISPDDPAGPEKLEHQINKRHSAIVSHAPPPAAADPKPERPRFSVKLDHWGHMTIAWGAGLEREETGLRGLPTLIANGLIRKPGSYHVDPMQRAIEIDGVRFECNEAGAKELEIALNTTYAAAARKDKAVAIEIKENHAASTGFDIRFTFHRAGVPLEIKGHLSQENLDILQDPAKCDLLQPGIHLLLAPPHLLIRKRRPDLGEEKIPELPDVNLMRTAALQLQQVLNHPLIRRNTGAGDSQVLQAAGSRAADIVEMRVTRNPVDKALLWLECITTGGETQPAKAFTHHNIVELQQSGVFLPHLEVHLSLDHQRLSVQDRQTHQEETLTLNTHSPDEVLRQAGRMLTNALKPRAPRPDASDAPVGMSPLLTGGAPAAGESRPAAELLESTPLKEAVKAGHPAEQAPHVVGSPVPAAASKPELEPSITSLFHETDAVRVNLEVFRRLEQWLGIAVQDIRLSLPCVFENRRFQVLNFEPKQISSLMELRGDEFYGFYLSHINEKKVVLVYACNGTHIEWGPDKCVLQPTVRAEAEEYKGSALLGMAQDRADEFVFVVQPVFKKWIEPREKPYIEENVQFRTPAEITAAPNDYRLIWPEQPAIPG